MYYRIHIDQVTGRRVGLVEPATVPKSEGWLKGLLHRTRLVGPGH
jgi:hypothetical protein